jgi:alcohol dehydrogenase (cytochrome c)
LILLKTELRILKGIMILAILFLAAPATPGFSDSHALSDAVPSEVAAHAQDWPLPNKDYGNSRATTDSEISSKNVGNLEIAWSVPINASSTFGGASSNPLIIGDAVYFQDLGSNVFSFDLETGAVNWKQIYNLTSIGPNGPAVGWGKVFVAKGVYNISALDEKTGKERWNFSTVDTPKIWGNKEVNSGGGCWYTPSVDLKTGIMFWGVGNPAPWPGTPKYPNGSSRPGPNLYTNCLLALDSGTGRMIWYTQVNSHDILDHDFETPPILARANVSGREQEMVIGAGKMGRVYAFNRSTGCILWTAVVGTHQNDQLAFLPNETIKVYPGYFGGVESPLAYADGVVYVPYVDLYTNYTDTRIVDAQDFGSAEGGLVALQVETGKVLWEKHFDSLNVGGATVINDLVFTGTFNGMIYALQRDTGRVAWQFEAPAGVNAWPAVAKDTIVWPCGTGSKPSLIALRHPSKQTIGP